MREPVAVGRHTLQDAREMEGCRSGSYRSCGRRTVLLAGLACMAVLVLAASSARAAGLPDGRGYELVTPPNKDNSGPYVRAGIFGGDQLSADGNAVSYAVLETFPGSQSFGGSFRAVRTSGGWTDANVIPPQSNITGALCSVEAAMVGYSSDMSKGILADGLGSADGSCPVDDPRLVPGEPEGVQNLFVSNLTNGTYQLVDVTPSGVTPSDAQYAGGSSDLSHVVFTEAAPLTPDAPGGTTNLYEWVGGTVRLVTQIPMAPATSCSGAACTAVMGSIASSTQPFYGVSDDGSMAYFTGGGNLYVRENGTSTVQVDAPAAGGSGPGGGGQLLAASADGSRVFFTDGDGAGLTNDTVSGSGQNLYEYDLTSGRLTDLTPSGDARVQGLSGISEDGSYIYFVADGSLASGATAGQPNMYVSHDGTTTFIATLDGTDSADWLSSAPTARASSNGRFFVFASIESLTGFNNMDAATSGKADKEIFRYDAATGDLTCVSCSPTGAAPTGDTNIDGAQNDGLTFGGQTILARYVSNSGQVFFDTPNALVSADTDAGLDTYEYEAGKPSLISSGTDPAGALYVDNTADGNNVVFLTSTPLVPQDADGGAYDIYDARVGGGFPVSSPTPPCQGDGCKPQQSTALPAPIPGTSAFTGPGNPKAATHTVAKITLMKRTVKGATFVLRLRVSGAGRIVISGRDIRGASRSVSHAGTYTVRVHLTSKAKNRLKHKRRLKLALRAQYVPPAGRASTVKFKRHGEGVGGRDESDRQGGSDASGREQQPNSTTLVGTRTGLLAFVLTYAVLALLGAAPAMANIGIADFSNAVLNQDGTTAATQAGSHPYEMVTTMNFDTDASGNPTDNVRDVKVGLPPGLIGNPTAIPRCPINELNNSGGFSTGLPGWPAESQVGQLTVEITGGTSLPVPLYNLVPPAGKPAQFGANILLANAFLDVTVNTGSDYGLTTTSSNVSALLPLVGLKVTLWGVPADPSHDADRVCEDGSTPCSINAPMTPLLTLPTACTGPLTATLSADAWDVPQGDFVHSTSTMPAMTGCSALSFGPSITVRPDTTVGDSPSGLDVDLHVPQAPNDATALAVPDVKTAAVTLPQGFTLNPSAADGLQACSEAQFGLDDASEPTCPNASKIGTAEIDSPIQPDPLVGGIYLAQQNTNPFGSTFAIYVATESDGVLIKLAANVQTNPATGQITTTFTNNPQLPFTDFKLHFFGGPRATFASPEGCGSFTATSHVTPYSSPASGADATPSDTFAINSGCVGAFRPTFTAGTVGPQAGSFSPFQVSFSRSDSDQELSGLTVRLPSGVSAKLAGVAECSDAAIAAAQAKSGAAELAGPSCPASSQVGTVTTTAGPGSDPFLLSGKVYLTGPFNGAPFGLAVIVPAVAGPLDLGTVVVRQALNIDPTDAHVTVTSQPFPTILKGVPLRLRRVDVDLNRPGFTVNPTSCDPMSISAAFTSTRGATANDSTRFQVGGCSSLGFTPKLKLGLTGKGKTRSGNHPALAANLTQNPLQANIRSAKVTLPLSLALDPTNSKHVCAVATAQAVHGGAVGCPSSTIVGTASAATPLLSQALTGKVYLVQGIRTNKQAQQIRTLPSLLIPLRGQIALDLRARTSVSTASW